MKGIKDVRLRIQCSKEYDHAKILPIGSFLSEAPKSLLEAGLTDRELKLYFARRIGEILCGNSSTYIYKPTGRSPIGRCALCGGELSFEIQEWEAKTKKTGVS